MDHFYTQVDPKRSSHWSLGDKIRKLNYFLDDVIGTKIDQKYVQRIKREYLNCFKSLSAENGIVGVSLRFRLIKIGSQNVPI